MEDHTKSNAQLKDDTEQKVFDLTPEMELPDQDNIDIIDLTNVIDSAETPAKARPEPLFTDADPEKPIVPEPPEAPGPDTRQPIDAEVDAAFDNIQAPVENESHLFEQLSDITQQVDSVIEDNIAGDDTVAMADRPQPVTTDDSPVADTAEFDAALSDAGDDDEAIDLADIVQPAEIKVQAPDLTENEDTLELTDIAQPDEIEAQATDLTEDEDILELTDIAQPDEIEAQAPDLTEDEDILELTDIAQPDEIEAQVTDLTEDEDILELTDIAQPDEIEAQVTDLTEDEDIIELTDIVRPAEIEAQATDLTEDEDILELTDIVQPADLQEEARETEIPAHDSQPAEAGQTPETTEWADLFVNEMSDSEKLHEAPLSDAADVSAIAGAPLSDFASDDEDEDQVIQLTDVLRQKPKPARLPIEKMKMGAEEDLEATPITLEQEDQANALGLDLEADAVLDQKIQAVVERIIQEKYADIIEQRIANEVENAVMREIAAIKRTLTEDDDSMV